MIAGVDCHCMTAGHMTEWCDACRHVVADCPCWLDEEYPDEDHEYDA